MYENAGSPELEAQCELAKDYGAMRQAAWTDLASAVISVRRMLFALRKKVLASPHAKRMTELSPPTSNP